MTCRYVSCLVPRLRVFLARLVAGRNKSGGDMPDFSVRHYGTDSSGRAILMTAYMADWWRMVVAELGFEPTIVQGAFMARVGGGAAASAGYHDLGGCLDLRVWDLISSEVAQVIRVTRQLGAGAWVRDERHGMDPHIHLVLGSDNPLASGAAWQWSEYLAGRDGLASRGPDYHPRPDPIVTRPPEDDDMPAYRDWNQADRDALMRDVRQAILGADLTPSNDENDTTVRGALNAAARLARAWRQEKRPGK